VLAAALPRRALLGSAAAALAAAAGCVARVQAVGAQVAVAAPAALAAKAARNLALASSLDATLSALTAAHAFSGTALVTLRDAVLLARGYGWADAAGKVPNTPATPLRIASLTKQFTAAAVLQLQARGLLTVRDRISAYLPQPPAAWSGITLHQLLTHTSGIPDYDTLPAWPALQTQRLTPEALIAAFRDAPLDFPPGTGWRYSDSGYVLLAYAVERLTGRAFSDYLQEQIFSPLGLADTGRYAATAAARLATGYTSWGCAAPRQDMSVYFGCGGLYSTVGDLHRWNDALTTGRPAILPPQALAAMFTPWARASSSVPGQVEHYGYGWFLTRQGGTQLYWHPGDISGYVAHAAIYPDAGLQVILLSNLESSDVRGIGTRLAGIALGA
jgi:CubicO group peptidase (beta-lactamase class C family)